MLVFWRAQSVIDAVNDARLHKLREVMNKPVTLIIMNFKLMFQNTNWNYYYDFGSQRGSQP